MTIRLLVDWKQYKAGNLATLDAGTETGLVAAKQADTNLAGGVPYIFSSLNTDSASRLKVKMLAKENIEIPSVMAVPPTITAGAASGNPATSTVRIIPWDGNTPQVNNILNSPHLWIYNSANMSGSRLVSGSAAQSSQERFDFVMPVIPSAPGGPVPTCMHFVFDGQVFELLAIAGVHISMVVNGKLASTGPYTTVNSNAWTKYDFGTRDIRYISLYINGRVGGLSIGVNDSISPWNRSKDINAVYHADSYAGVASPNLLTGGPFSDAFLRLGFASWWGVNHGGGAYYNAGETSNAATAFAQLRAVDQCDLWMVGLGINETRSTIGAALYDETVLSYYKSVRAAFPNAVIAAIGPWAPTESSALTATRTDISDSVYAQLQKISGPWVFMDNLTGNWYNSVKAKGLNKSASTSSTTTVNGGPSINTLSQSPVQSGTWQTGEGRVGAVTGKGNGDLYVSSDATHPSAAGVSYLGSMIAHNLRQGILNL